MEQDVKDSLEKKLEAAVSSTTETEVESTTKEAEGSKENRIPQSRFNEVNSALKEEKSQREALQAQLAEAQSSVVKMAELLELKEQDVQTLNEIKGLAHDPEMRAHILAIDAKLKGEVEKVETGKSTPDEAMKAAREIMDTSREQLLDTQAELQAEALVTRADVIADKLLAQLPEAYTDQDLNIVQELWSERVNWDKIVKDPETLASVLTDSLQEVLNVYGTPRGALFTSEEVEELTPKVATETLTPEQELEALMANESLGKMKEVKTASGKVRYEPELSDADFSKSLAIAMREAHKSKK